MLPWRPVHAICVSLDIAAPANVCFDLARSVEAHLQSAADTGERVVAGRASGLMELGDEITFEGRHFGLHQRLSARITQFDRPRSFRDEMTRGAFRSLTHDHRFESLSPGLTRMTDVVRFDVPGGWLGWPIGQWLVGPHLRRFLLRRGQALKTMAEAAR